MTLAGSALSPASLSRSSSVMPTSASYEEAARSLATSLAQTTAASSASDILTAAEFYRSAVPPAPPARSNLHTPRPLPTMYFLDALYDADEDAQADEIATQQGYQDFGEYINVCTSKTPSLCPSSSSSL